MPQLDMPEPDAALAAEIERHAVELARGAGRLLAGHFGQQLAVEFKDEQQRDPVTAADKAVQAYLSGEIARRFPGHGILGEEADAAERESEAPAPDFLWILDPLDGTTNFLNGLPVFASSIGVMHRGRLLAGALFLPWPAAPTPVGGASAHLTIPADTPPSSDGGLPPGGASGGFVLHCRRGGGCYADGVPAAVYETAEPVANRLIGVPGYFGAVHRFAGPLAQKAGEPRTTGSIAYELALTARGVMQYCIIGAPRLWDMAAGALAVQEAGGAVMLRHPGQRHWQPLDRLLPTWDERRPTMKELRQWAAPLIAGNRQLAPLVAANLRRRFSLSAQLRRLTRPRRRRP